MSTDDDSDNGKDKRSSHRAGLAVVCPPPSFHDPASGNTRPYYLFPLFVIINVATMTDRAIVAGAGREFSAFVSGAHDSPQFVQDNPDAGIGLLQAVFIFGYSMALLLSGHFVHTCRWKTLVLSGMIVWWLAVLGSGNAKQYDSFYVLLFSRMATGVSEAAFQVVAPPLIQDRGGTLSGLWLSLFLTGQPVGLAAGYIYGSRMATSDAYGWDWAYYFICIATLPVVLALMLVRDNTNGGLLSGAGDSAAIDADAPGSGESTSTVSDEPLLARTYEVDIRTRQRSVEEGHPEHQNCTPPPLQKHTLLSGMEACLSSPILVTLSLGWAAIMGVIASLGTFGGAFVVALQLFDDEREAACWFGIACGLAGVIGTPLGGKMADKVLKRYADGDRDAVGSGAGLEGVLRYPIIASLTSKILILAIVSLIFIVPTLAMHDGACFLTFLFLGWTPLFMTQTAINLIAMASVDRSHRPNALAFLTLTSHLLGDVPLPVMFGFIKDKWAPACRVGASGEFDDAAQCQEQEVGVRKTLAISYAWVLWSLLFFALARHFALREARKANREASLFLEEKAEAREGHGFQYYHSRFGPPGPDQGAGSDESSTLYRNAATVE